MSLQESVPAGSGFSIAEPPPNALHDCRTSQEFVTAFESLTGRAPGRVPDDVVDPAVPKAVFLVGSLPLGMANSSSDIDFIVLVNDKNVLIRHEGQRANNQQEVTFTNDSDSLLAGDFMTLMSATSVDITVVVAPAIKQIQNRLRRRGPELNENEIMVLSRLSSGWLLWQSEGFLQTHQLVLTDPALDIYCATRYFTLALLYRRKALKALAFSDLPLALHLGRLGAEMAYLAYFASEGLSYLGPKWPAQIGRAHSASDRVSRHPLLAQSIHLLFPALQSDPEPTATYLQAVTGLLTSMRTLIEQKTLFRIAFRACPQIYAV